VTKTELVEAVARDLNMTRVDAQRAVESVFGQIAEGLARDKKVQIQGFGTFQSKMRKAREGINPQTKQRMQIPASKTVGFKPGQELKSKI
jgi:DNA-binding protein HU-beta